MSHFQSTYGVMGSTAPPQVESQVVLALYGKADAGSIPAEWYLLSLSMIPVLG